MKKAKTKIKSRKKPTPAEEVEVLEPEIEVLPPEIEEVESPEVEEEELSTTKDIVRYSPLQAYLREISRLTPMSREEEHDVAVRYYKNKEKEAAIKLIQSNLWLVVKIAKEYERAARSLLDIIQEGNIGLMEAVGNFDPYRGVRFPSYAVWWIKAYIIRYVMANWRMVKIGTTQAQRKLFFNLKKEKDRLEREGFFPAPKLLAENLNVKEHEVIEMEQRLGSSDLSVDAPAGEESDSDMLSIMPSKQPNAEDLLSQREMQDLVKRSMGQFRSELNDKEKVIFDERLLSEEKVTLQVVADKLHLSKERVRQIEERIKKKLKQYLSNALGDNGTTVDYS
jgi:RNA polymerase sigma-32 factor